MWARKPSSSASCSQRGLVDGAEQLDRAVLERLEQVGVDAAEQGDGLVVPAPPQVVGELLQGLQAFGQTAAGR